MKDLSPERVLLRSAVKSYCIMADHVERANNEFAFYNMGLLIDSFVKCYGVNDRYWRIIMLRKKLSEKKQKREDWKTSISIRKAGNKYDAHAWVKKVIQSAETAEQYKSAKNLMHHFLDKWVPTTTVIFGCLVNITTWKETRLGRELLNECERKLSELKKKKLIKSTTLI